MPAKHRGKKMKRTKQYRKEVKKVKLKLRKEWKKEGIW
jgi:hypothetical protein